MQIQHPISGWDGMGEEQAAGLREGQRHLRGLLLASSTAG